MRKLSLKTKTPELHEMNDIADNIGRYAGKLAGRANREAHEVVHIVEHRLSDVAKILAKEMRGTRVQAGVIAVMAGIVGMIIYKASISGKTRSRSRKTS